MTPSNPDNSKPFIYRICDALGITHLVVAVQHSHLMSEITGLVDALAAKANAVPAGSPTGGIVIANTAGELSRSDKTLNDLMPVMTIDSTPTASSPNLVTSGGVKAALNAISTELAGKAPLDDTQVMYKSLDKSQGGGVQYIDVDEMFQGGNTQVSLIIENSYEDKVPLVDAFFSQTQDAFAFMTDMVDIPDGAILSCRILLCESVKGISCKYFVVIDGIIEV